MTAITETRVNMVLALALPAAGLAYLTFGVFAAPSWSTIGAMIVLGVLWLTATIAVSTARRPRLDTVAPVQEVAENIAPLRVLTPAYPAYVVDVSRQVRPWRWTSVLLAPVELLALAWTIPVLILLIMVPVGLALASVLWVGRLILRP